MAYRRSRHRRMSGKAGRRMTKRAGRVSRKVRRSRRVRRGGNSPPKAVTYAEQLPGKSTFALA